MIEALRVQTKGQSEMSKDKRRRNRRRNRDDRWLARIEAGIQGWITPTGRHRAFKIYGESQCLGWDANGQEITTSTAFWCKETDDSPKFAMRYRTARLVSARVMRFLSADKEERSGEAI